MLMTPLLLKVAQERPRLRVEIARASTELLVQALRERDLDALVVDARSLRPAPDLNAQACTTCAAPSWCAAGTRWRSGARLRTLSFDRPAALSASASTPLSDEVASAVLVELLRAACPPGEPAA
jgi:hypothetical protein